MSKEAILLVNLGSPDSTSIPDVRRYLREFLMDERVIDVPWLNRFFLVNFLILPFRPARTAEAYRSIWTEEGSPLLVLSRKLQAALQARFSMPVALAMRYQNPSIPDILAGLAEQDVSRILLVPLYPHYALSSSETVIVRVQECLKQKWPEKQLKILPPFYQDSDYIRALVASAQPYLQTPYDHLLFSFHGLPERHLRKTDPTGSHCLQSPDCCEKASPALPTCYRAQSFRTVSAFVEQAKIPKDKYSVAFQSRLGRDPWLKPYTDLEITRLAREGAKRLLVICPSFVSDCLETLEEIQMRGNETFTEAGGESLQLIPCLNEHPEWIDALEKMIRRLAHSP